MAQPWQPPADGTSEQFRYQGDLVHRQYIETYGNPEQRLDFIDKYVTDGRDFRNDMNDLVDVDHLPDGAVIVDVACGSGRLGIDLRERRGVMHTIIGIDISELQLEAAEVRQQKRGIKPIIFRQGDMEHLEELPDGFADVVIGSFSYPFAKDVRRAVSEAARILKPGGQHITSANSLFQKLFHWDVLETAAAELGKGVPKIFADKFNSHNAYRFLSPCFDILPRAPGEPDHFQATELRVPYNEDNIEYFILSLLTYQSEFTKPITTPNERQKFIDIIKRELAKNAAENGGYIIDSAVRNMYNCRKKAEAAVRAVALVD